MVQDVIHFLTFRLDDRLYGLRLSQTDRVVRAVDCTPLPNAPPLVVGVIDVHGNVIPVLDVRRRFGLPPREIGLTDQFVIAHTAHRTVALIVQAVGAIVQRSAEQFVAAQGITDSSHTIDGVVRDNGELILIHDLERFLSSEDEQRLHGALIEMEHERDLANQPAE